MSLRVRARSEATLLLSRNPATRLVCLKGVDRALESNTCCCKYEPGTHLLCYYSYSCHRSSAECCLELGLLAGVEVQ